ncbi:transcriptional regulator [Amylibacter marinus]|uniref:Transcriptional regulator n=1 Tax=Amylibacter marinus TaxID=1475483 RepID=A0ABQ5VW68_9RHOB|nr:FMN-binding negative transcriptional regulator [Amylibacter marinus]GLQ35306.1 transcriptional regulator [Amylibacter marinus]
MYQAPSFHKQTKAKNIELARKRGFGVLGVNGGGNHPPCLVHIPFVLNEAGTELRAHLMRSNPIARLLTQPLQAVMAVSGPDGYISPDWYEIPDQVPTWNYVSVHLLGLLSLLPAEDLQQVIDDTSQVMEERLAPKPVWHSRKMQPDTLERMTRMIVPVKMEITEVTSTWKLGQNKDEGVRLRAAQAVKTSGIGVELDELSAFMQDPPT